MIDAVRIIKLALNNGLAGELDGPSSYLMKSPHTQRPDPVARDMTEEFIRKYARTPAGEAPREPAADASRNAHSSRAAEMIRPLGPMLRAWSASRSPT